MKKYNILNTYVNIVSEQNLNKHIIEFVIKKKKTFIGYLNIHGANLSYENTPVKKFYDKTSIIFCDGAGIILACKILNYKTLPSKITYNTWFPRLIKDCEKNNLKVFVLGSNKNTNQNAILNLKSLAPNLKINGHHGYFNKQNHENDLTISKINKFRPDILVVGFGMPLQEKWILDNYQKIDSTVFMNGGAFLEWISGSQVQCPKFISDIGFEWLWRLFFSPRRLFRRYILGNFIFLYRITFKKK